ncbi:DUF4058 family protein [Scytonema sp. NUACC26]|uniref:DUF4058 family protein n=1 Tax=Scytonema sp. NUACC26 TaxID=3140176 RepID=UPI0034DC052E
MNPYLENPELWSEVNSWLIVLLARERDPLLTPKYRTAVEKFGSGKHVVKFKHAPRIGSP